jgi:protein-tyrosine phosphatase
VDGFYGRLFEALGSFDKPFNQAPSLHISLLAIISLRLLAHAVRPAARGAIHAWTILVGLSVLTTYQHHFIDVPTGALAGLLCIWLWPEAGPSPLAAWRLTADGRRRRLALCYLAGAVACAAAALAFGGWWLWLWWPAVSLGLVAANYLGFGASGFQKNERGQLSSASRWLLAPYLAGAWINSRAWTRGEPSAHHVVDDVWLGRMPTRAEIVRSSFGALVDLTAEMSGPAGLARYSTHPVLDLTVASPPTLLEAAHAIEGYRRGGSVLVCCALGYSRSATAVASWLLQTRRAPGIRQAVDTVTRARPRVVLGDEHLRVLEALQP